MRERRTKEIISHSSADGSRGRLNLCCAALLSPSSNLFSRECGQFHLPRAISLKRKEREDATKEKGKRAIVNRYEGGTLKEGKGR